MTHIFEMRVAMTGGGLNDVRNHPQGHLHVSKIAYGHRLYLHREPENKADNCAVLVTDLAYRRAGYIRAVDAPLVFALLNQGVDLKCHAEVEKVLGGKVIHLKLSAPVTPDQLAAARAEVEHREHHRNYKPLGCKHAKPVVISDEDDEDVPFPMWPTDDLLQD